MEPPPFCFTSGLLSCKIIQGCPVFVSARRYMLPLLAVGKSPPRSELTTAGMTNKPARAVGTGPRACPPPCSARDNHRGLSLQTPHRSARYADYENRAFLQPGIGGILRVHRYMTHLTSSITSSSTGAPRGSSATPTATLACLPLSPKISAARLDAPFTTRGWAVKSGATAT